MDKFVTRTKLPPREVVPSHAAPRPRVQATISAMAGVVSLDGVRSLCEGLNDAAAQP
jgi:hypothetical protein